MEYVRKENDIVVRLDKGEEVISSLLSIAKKENIIAAYISGLGASNCFNVGVFAETSKTYTEKNYQGSYEITSLVGNLSQKDDLPYLHIHANFASLNEIVGGHLTKCYISVTAEIFIHIIDIKLNRKYSEEIGINLFDFNK